MSSSVTLAEVLQAKGCPLEEEEIWALMGLGTERLLEDLHKESSSYVISPWSVLLSAEGSLSFKDNVSQANMAPFRAPEILCEHDKSNCGLTKMLMYSLGMTLYWSADYQLSPSQPLQLSDQLHTILLSLCEDLPHKRLSPESVLEACDAYQMQSSQCSPNTFIKRLATFVLRSVRQVELGANEDHVYAQLNRSNEIRKRLHEKMVECSALPSQLNLHQGSKSMNYSHSAEGYRELSKDYADSSSISENTSLILPDQGCRRDRTPEAQKSCDSNYRGSRTHSSYKLFINRSTSTMDEIPNGIEKNSSHKVLCMGSSSIFSGPPKDSSSAPVFSRCLFQRKEKFSGPEFIILSNEPPVTLQLPGSIVTKKGKSSFSQRDVSVILLNGQCLEVKCNIKSKAQEVFNTVVAYANLVEHFYFGLAYMKGKEFFFLDDDTKLYKVAPEGWTDQHKKKTSIINFTMFLRIRFFVDDFNVIQHGLTRHQFYLQLRKDLLEERLYCSDKTVLQLGALALQAELGNYAPEVHGKTYFRVEDYVPAHQIEKLTLEHIQFELAKLHSRTHSLFEEEAELEFLKLTQQLPEYGVFFHHVFQEKKTVVGDLILGICAKGIIVYEVKNHTRIAIIQFQWRETERISAHRKKFTIESSFSGKKHTFLTDTVKTCKYLLDLCSAQHRFSAQINSWQLLQAPSGDSRFMEIVRSHSAFISPRDELTLIQRLSRSENVLYGTNLESISAEVVSKSCDNLSVETSNESGEKSNLGRPPSRLSQSETHINLNEKQRSYDHLSIHSNQNTASASGSPCNQHKSSLSRVEREIICVTLKRDPKNGFGFVIIGGEAVGKLDLGIFIASIIPGGPADRAGHIKPGGRLISVNNISLEGVSFNTAVKLIQNSPDEVELIISQPKDGFEEGLNEERNLPRKISSTSGSEISCIESERQITEDSHTAPAEGDGNVDNEPKKVISQNIAPKVVPKFLVCSADSLVSQEGYPLPAAESQGDDTYSVELTKENDSFGICVTGGISTNVKYGGIYVKSIIPNGPADKDGQIKKGDRLLEVDGISLRGVTQRQAVESLKRSKQVAKLVLARACHIPAELSPGDNTNKDEHMSLPLTVPTVSESPKGPSFIRDDNTFEVTLRKNSGGLGFSFLQMEGDVRERFGRDIVRIKRLFPGQPAEENGEIDVGDIILAVNGKSVQGLLYQEVLHLLRGAPPDVTLRLCRPPRGILPEIDQTSLSPLPSPAKEFVPSLEPRYGLDDTVSDEEGSSPAPNSPRAARDRELIEAEHSVREEHDIGNNSTKSLSKSDSPGECSYKHRWKIRQEAITSETFLSLEEEVRQGCYSPCELERAQSPVFEKSDDDPTTKYCQPEIRSPTPVDEEYLIISSASFTPLSRGGKSEMSTTLESNGLGPTSVSLPGKLLHASDDDDDEWEDLEEAEQQTVKEQWNVRETKFSMTLTRSVNGSYGFTVVVNKTDDILYVAEILGEPALSDGRLRRGDRLLMVNGKDATTLSAKETLDILCSSSCDLHLVVGRITTESSSSPRLDEIPEITLTKGDCGQLGLKLTGGVGSKQQGIYVLDIVPGSPASQEGSLQPLDEIVCICGLRTEGMSLDDAVRACDAASQIVCVRATRNGEPVIPLKLQNRTSHASPGPPSFSTTSEDPTEPWLPKERVDMQAPLANEQERHLSSKHTKFLLEDSFTPEHSASSSAVHEDCIINIELEKAANGSLGFALVGGRNGRAILIKAISPGSIADIDGRLRVGDILLKVNGHFVSGLTRNTVIDILRKAHSTVQLTVCRSAALRWAYLDRRWNESPFQYGSAQLDEHGNLGVLGAQEDFMLQGQEESSQMYSKDSDDKSSLPVQGERPEYPESSSAGQQTTQMQELAEAATGLSDDEDIARRLAGWPRGATLVSEEELSQLVQIKPSKTKYGLRFGIRDLIQKLQWQIEQQQEITKEFVSLEHLKPLDNCLIGKAPENREKNRYRDILPYDETRVPLGPMKAYINASYIRILLDKEQLFYISTQGPLPSTINDFWQMVWENHSNVIAMITRETERGISKCHRYWPEPPHDSMDLIEFQLRLDNYQILDCFIIRMIELTDKQTQARRIVHHLQFTTWPDHGTPKSSEDFVKYVRYMRKIHQTGPIIAHCSAGIGRSGVLLCVDIVLNHIEKDMIFDIKQIVKDLRYQRFGMIQTKAQYIFCYEIALEVLKNIWNMDPQLLQ